MPSVSAPEGSSIATSPSTPGIESGGTTMPPPRSSTNHTMLASASTTSAFSAPPSSTPSAPNDSVPTTTSTSTHARPAGSGDQPMSAASTPSTTICTATTTSPATARPPTRSHLGSAVAGLVVVAVQIVVLGDRAPADQEPPRQRGRGEPLQ